MSDISPWCDWWIVLGGCHKLFFSPVWITEPKGRRDRRVWARLEGALQGTGLVETWSAQGQVWDQHFPSGCHLSSSCCCCCCRPGVLWHHKHGWSHVLAPAWKHCRPVMRCIPPLPLSSRKRWILILPCDSESQGLRHMPFVPQLSSAPAPGCVGAQWGKRETWGDRLSTSHPLQVLGVNALLPAWWMSRMGRTPSPTHHWSLSKRTGVQHSMDIECTENKEGA